MNSTGLEAWITVKLCSRYGDPFPFTSRDSATKRYHRCQKLIRERINFNKETLQGFGEFSGRTPSKELDENGKRNDGYRSSLKKFRWQITTGNLDGLEFNDHARNYRRGIKASDFGKINNTR